MDKKNNLLRVCITLALILYITSSYAQKTFFYVPDRDYWNGELVTADNLVEKRPAYITFYNNYCIIKKIKANGTYTEGKTYYYVRKEGNVLVYQYSTTDWLKALYTIKVKEDYSVVNVIWLHQSSGENGFTVYKKSDPSKYRENRDIL